MRLPPRDLVTKLALSAVILALPVTAWGAEPSWREAVAGARPAQGGVLTTEDAAGAVDGDASGRFHFHTSGREEPWWQVDLSEESVLARMVIHSPHMPERLEGFQVQLSRDGATWTTAHENAEPTEGEPKIEVDLGGRSARYVRISVPRVTWLHLTEVQVFGIDEPTRNLADHRPANQSSTSEWSTRSIALEPVEYDWTTDHASALRAIARVARHAGPDATSLNERAASLSAEEIAVDAEAWSDLYAQAVESRSRWSAVGTQWPLMDADALERLVRRLCRRHPDLYPDEASYLGRIDALRRQTDPITAGMAAGDRDQWLRAEGFVELQRDLLLRNPAVDFDSLILLRRTLGPAARSAIGAQLGVGTLNAHTNDTLPRTGWTNDVARLQGLRQAPALETLHRPDGGRIVKDLELSFDAEALMFSSVGDAQPNWRVFELDLTSGDLSQVVPDDGEDVGHFDSCYLPDGDVIFASTATYQGLPCEYGSRHMVSLYRLYRDTGVVRQLTFEQDSDWCPTVLHDGRVMYLRWEYTDLPHSNSRILFRMKPDGTKQEEYYGSGSYFTPSFFFARPIPGHPSQVVGIAGGHHGNPRSGRMLVLDPGLGHHEAEGVVQEIPGWGKDVEPIVRDRLVDGVWPQILHPWPLDEEQFIVAMKPEPDALWGIYLVDVFDNMTLIHQAEGEALLEPLVPTPRPTPPVIPDRVDPAQDEASAFVADIYQGPGLDGVPRGTVKELRVGTYYFSSRGVGGLLGSIGMDGPWDIKRVLGTVPVDGSGSASFKIPANTPIFLQPLDESGQAVQLMRSWLVGMPGEAVSCAGCHEAREEAVVTTLPEASTRPPDEITPWEGHGPVHGFAFVDDVQPTLDRFCVGCHDGQPYGGGAPLMDLRGEEWITDWSSQISGNCGPSRGGNFTVSYANLHRFVRRPGIESDLRMLAPAEFKADTTELVQMLMYGRHHGVELDDYGWDSLITWIDLNAPFHGTWSDVAPVAAEQ
ncbi:MAG: hypothetical protein GF320_08525, partial [Armatimonadia bacterium]|nr:hypothetical protein [Armatimonadia bacterium]